MRSRGNGLRSRGNGVQSTGNGMRSTGNEGCGAQETKGAEHRNRRRPLVWVVGI